MLRMVTGENLTGSQFGLAQRGKRKMLTVWHREEKEKC